MTVMNPSLRKFAAKRHILLHKYLTSSIDTHTQVLKILAWQDHKTAFAFEKTTHMSVSAH